MANSIFRGRKEITLYSTGRKCPLSAQDAAYNFLSSGMLGHIQQSPGPWAIYPADEGLPQANWGQSTGPIASKTTTGASQYPDAALVEKTLTNMQTGQAIHITAPAGWQLDGAGNLQNLVQSIHGSPFIFLRDGRVLAATQDNAGAIYYCLIDTTTAGATVAPSYTKLTLAAGSDVMYSGSAFPAGNVVTGAFATEANQLYGVEVAISPGVSAFGLHCSGWFASNTSTPAQGWLIFDPASGVQSKWANAPLPAVFTNNLVLGWWADVANGINYLMTTNAAFTGFVLYSMTVSGANWDTITYTLISDLAIDPAATDGANLIYPSESCGSDYGWLLYTSGTSPDASVADGSPVYLFSPDMTQFWELVFLQGDANVQGNGVGGYGPGFSSSRPTVPLYASDGTLWYLNPGLTAGPSGIDPHASDIYASAAAPAPPAAAGALITGTMVGSWSAAQIGGGSL